MRPFRRSRIVLVPLFIAAALPSRPASSPLFSHENLRYSINWPSGLSLGESQLRAVASDPSGASPAKLELEFDIEAALPGFQVLDRYHSITSSDLCSLQFDKKTSHGRKKVEEKIVFDPRKQTATRETVGGGKSELKTSACGKDALAFLYFVRRGLAQGRMPPSEPVYFGAAYQIRLEYAGVQTIRLGDTSVETDRITASLKGPSSEFNFEVLFLKDAARTPALVRVPLSMGTFSMELVREP